MSLSASTLETALIAALNAGAAEINPASVAGLADYHEMIAHAVATTVVAHIKAAATVAVSGATACGAGAGTFTGTGTVA